MSPRLTLLAAALVLCACNEAVAPDPVPEGTLSFTYTGALEGTFSATGAPPRATSSPVTFATGMGSGSGVLGIMAYLARGGSQDGFSLMLRDVSGPGTYRATAMYRRDINGPPDLQTMTYNSFLLLENEVVITSLTPTRVQGTFSGTATRGSLSYLGPRDSIHITGGTFDVPITR